MAETAPHSELDVAEPTAPANAATILIAEDDDGHAELLRICLRQAGLKNPFIRFTDGQEVLDFLFRRGNGLHREHGRSYLLMLDIRMPKIDGLEALRQIKAAPEISRIPVIVLTTTDDARVVDECYALGCGLFITKPTNADEFFEAIRRIGMIVQLLSMPRVNGNENPHHEDH